MAYLKRVLKPRGQIKFVYITNTYKALLRDKSNNKIGGFSVFTKNNG